MNDAVGATELNKAAEEIARLRKALEFYSDPRRYEGPNLRPIPDDPYATPNAAYIMDVTRDRGAIATKALRSL